MKNNLPEPKFYSLKILAERFGVEEDDLLHYGYTGQLKICVISDWYLEKGIVERIDENDYEAIPQKVFWSSGVLLCLEKADIKKILSLGKIVQPSFLGLEGEYIRISLNHHFGKRQVIITRSDLVISQESIKSFLALNGNSPAISMIDNSYKSPYIELMFKAIQIHEISDENQGKAAALKKWFLDQKIGGHKITENEAKLLSTFIRLPSSKRGGNKPFKIKGETLPRSLV